MAPSLSWKGYLKLSLVSCAVAMAPARSGNEKIRFNNLNRETGNRLKQQYRDAETGDVVEREDIVKGYQYEKGKYVQVEQEDLDSVALESRHTIDIDFFVPQDELDPLYFDDMHYLVPDDEVAVEAYSVIREAMKKDKVAGIARLTMNDRERWIAVQPRGKGILLTRLKYPYEVRPEAVVFDRIDDDKPDEKSVKATEELIEQMTGDFKPVQKGKYEAALEKMLKQKQAGREVEEVTIGGAEAKKTTGAKNLLDTLRAAIDADKKKKPKAAAANRKGRKAA